MKMQERLKNLKKNDQNLSKEIHEMTDEEFDHVSGGAVGNASHRKSEPLKLRPPLRPHKK